MRLKKYLFSYLTLSIVAISSLYSQKKDPFLKFFPEIPLEKFEESHSLFNIEVNGNTLYSSDLKPFTENSFIDPSTGVEAKITEFKNDKPDLAWLIEFQNNSSNSLKIENLIPLGPSDKHPYITGYGPPGLTRATLVRPGEDPFGLIVPDNAWEMGYSSIRLRDINGMCL